MNNRGVVALATLLIVFVLSGLAGVGGYYYNPCQPCPPAQEVPASIPAK